MKNQLRDIFFQLLRIGLWRKGSLSDNTQLKEHDWSQIFAWAIPHTAEGIIFDSFAFLNQE